MRINALSIAATLAALASSTLAFSRPTVETLTPDQTETELHVWLRGNQAAIDRHAGITLNQVPDLADCLKNLPTNRPEDLMLYILWQTGDVIKAGDLYVLHVKAGVTVREVRAVTAAYVQTLAGTKIPVADVRGVVRRVIRVSPSAAAPVVPPAAPVATPVAFMFER